MPLYFIVPLVTAHVVFSGCRFTLNLYAQRLGADALQLGVVMGLMMAVAIFTAIPVGRWADRVGHGRPAALGLGVTASGALLGALAEQITTLYLASALVGTGYMTAHVALNNVIGRAADPPQLTRTFAVLAVGFSISGMSGPMISGPLIDRFGPWAAFCVLACFPLLSAVMLFGLVRRTVPPLQRTPGQPAGRSTELLRHPRLREVFLVTTLLSMGWDLFLLLVPLHGSRVGLSATAIGTIMAAYSAGTLSARVVMSGVGRRWPPWRVVGGALAVSALGYAVLPLLSTLPLLLAVAYVMGTGLGCGQPISMSLMHTVSPPGRSGEAVGIRSTIVSSTQTVLPMSFGALGASLGVLGIFWTTALLLGSGGAYAWTRGRGRRTEG